MPSLRERLAQSIIGIGKKIDPIPQSLIRGIQKITPAVPGTKMAQRVISTQIARQSEKRQKEIERINRDLGESLSRIIKDPKVKKEDKSRLVKGYAKLAENSNILRDVPEVTGKEIISEAGQLAILAAIGLKPGLGGFGVTGKVVPQTAIQAFQNLQKVTKAINAEKRVRKFGTVGKVLNVAEKAGKQITTDFIIGAGFFGAAAFGEDKKPKELAMEAGIGGVISAAIPPVIGGAVRGTSSLLRTFGKEIISPSAKAIERKLQEAAMGVEKAVRMKQADTEVNRTLAVIPSRFTTIKKNVARAALRGIEEIRSIPAKFTDRFHVGKRIESAIEDAKGAPLDESEKVYRNMRLTHPTAEGRAENAIVDFVNRQKSYKDIQDHVTARLLKLDAIDRARLGQKVAAEETVEQLEAGLQRLVLEAKEQEPRIQSALQEYNQFNRRLLQERMDAGLISKETMDNLLKTHPNYIPHNVVRDIDEEIANTFGTSQTLNVSKTDIKKAVGSTRELEDPWVATLKRTPIAYQLIEKNKTLRGLVEAQEKYSIVSGMRQIKGEEKVGLGELTINLFRNGKKETWAVPSDLAIAIKNLEGESMGRIMRFITTPARILKNFATRFNLSFTIPNKLRDKQTALLTADAFIEALATKTQTLPKDITHFSPQELFRLWKEAGGSGASIFREVGGISNADKLLKRLEKSGWSKFANEARPDILIDSINQSIEESTRLQVFRKGLERGLSPRDAAFASRDATIDFSKMGTVMRNLNQIVPFLNARVQGLINLPRAFVSNPEHFARMQMWSSVYPTLALQQHNRQFKSYGNVPQYMKNNYWVVMVGEEEGLDNNGNAITIPQFVSIRKGEGQSLVSNPIQFFLDKSDKIDFRTTTQMLVDTLGQVSPVAFQEFDTERLFLAIPAALGPIGTIPTGLGTNLDPFRGTQIVPESRLKAPPELQFKKTTPETTRDLANLIGVAPAKLEFVLNSFGGVPQDVQQLFNIGTGLAKGEGLRTTPLEPSPFGQATRLPVVGKFLREAGEFFSPEAEFRREQKGKVEEIITGEKLKVKDKAEDLWIQMLQMKTPEERKNWIQNQNITLKIKEQLQAIKKRGQTFEALTKNDSVDVRALYIWERLLEMKQDNISNNVIIETFLKPLKENKIITKDVEATLNQLKKRQQPSLINQPR